MKTVSRERWGKRRNGRRLLGGALAGVGLISTIFTACAKGNTDDSSAGGAGGQGGGSPASDASTSSASSSSGLMPGQVGSPCTADTDCASGTCTPVGANKYCTTPCPPGCPSGTYCSIIGGATVCIPDLDQECGKCKAATDCKMPSDECLKAPLGDTFCARDCTPEGTCGNGFTCIDKPTYTGGGGGADGGAPDAGGKDGGGDAAKDGGGDAGDGGKPPAVPAKWCVPNSGFSCPCDPKRDGIVHDCHVKNNFGDCSGKETCDGAKAMWLGCGAATPVAETCNNKDDNCDGMIDEGDPNALCVSLGAKPPHASYACTSGMCSLGKCDPGWAAFPPGPPSAGCPCAIEATEPNGSCAVATAAGSVSDTGGAITLTGTLSSANDVDFWSFTTVDTNQGATNSYHVGISFTAPTPNDEFLMDVIRDAVCVDSPVGTGTAITSYDWGVNGQSGTLGEAPCGLVAGQAHCADHSSPYFVRVYRKPGAVASCTQYSIAVTAMAGASDFSMQCP